MDLSESFYIYLVTAIGAILAALIKLCYDSKCRRISVCGVIIERDIEHETQLELSRIDHHIENPSRAI